MSSINYVQAALRSDDSLVDSNGFADGWAIKGTAPTNLGIPANTTAHLFDNAGGHPPQGRFADGTIVSGFETRLPWTAILPVNPAYTNSPFPIDFHISALNGTSLGSVNDNMGGPGGRIGSFSFSSVTLTPNNTSSTLQNNTICYNQTITNTGVFADTYTLTSSSSNGYTTSIKSGTCASPGGTITQTSQIAAGGTYTIAVYVTIPSSAPNASADTTTVTATSVLSTSVSASATNTTGIGALTITPPAQTKNGCLVGPNPLCTVSYTETITNNVLADKIDMRGVSVPGWKVEYLDPNNGNAVFATDLNGNGTFTDAGDSIVAGYDLNGNNYPDFNMTQATNRNFIVRISPNSGTPGTTIGILTLTVSSSVNAAQASAIDTTPLLPPTELIPEYKISAGANLYGAKGFPVFFPHLLRNNTNSSAFYALTSTNTDGPPTFTRTWWSDPNCDGDKIDGSVISQSNTLAGNGGSQCVVLEVDIPATTGLSQSTTTATAAPGTGQPAVGSANAQDDLMVSQVAAFVDGAFSVQGGYFTNGSTLYMKGFSLATATQFRIRLVNPAPSSTVVQNHLLVTNGNGDVFDSYTFASGDATGTWTIQLRNAADTATIGSITITVERNGSVFNVTTGKISYPTSGTPVSFSADFRNTNTVADYGPLTLEFSIRDQAGTMYMTSGGTFASDGTGLLDTYTQGVASLANSTTTSGAGSIASPIFPSRGVYVLHARWKLNIGSVIPSDTTYTFLVGPTVDSYSDSGRTIVAEDFSINAGAQVYLKGDIYVASTNVQYAIYDPSGNLITTTTSLANVSGVITPAFDSTGQTRTGTWHVGIYPVGATIPATYSTTDPTRYATDSFRLTYQLQGLAGSTSTTNQVGLTWTGVPAIETSNGGGYKVYRSTDGGSTFNWISGPGLLSSASYTDSSLINCETYKYKVSYINAEGIEEPQSTTITKQPTSGLAPANIGNTQHGDKTGGARYYWSAVSQDTGGNAVGIDHYTIRSGAIGNFVTVNQTSTQAGVSWVDPRSLTDGNNYWYLIYVTDKCGMESN